MLEQELASCTRAREALEARASSSDGPEVLRSLLAQRESELSEAADIASALAEEVSQLQQALAQKDELAAQWRREAEASLAEATRAMEAAAAAARLVDDVSSIEERAEVLETQLAQTEQRVQAVERERQELQQRVAQLLGGLEDAIARLEEAEAERQQLADRLALVEAEAKAQAAASRGPDPALEALRREVAAEALAARELLDMAQQVAEVLGQQLDAAGDRQGQQVSNNGAAHASPALVAELEAELAAEAERADGAEARCLDLESRLADALALASSSAGGQRRQEAALAQLQEELLERLAVAEVESKALRGQLDAAVEANQQLALDLESLRRERHQEAQGESPCPPPL